MDEAQASRRRRGAGIVTPNACTECRKKRSKCNGQIPCSRCAAVSAECIYEAPVRQSKETMRGEIELLTRHRQKSERVLGAISSGHKVQEILNRLRNGDSLETITEWLDHIASQTMEIAQNITTFPLDNNNDTRGNTLNLAESVGSYMGFAAIQEPDDLLRQQTRTSGQSSESTHPYSTSTYSGQGDDAINRTLDFHSHQSHVDAPLSRPPVGEPSQREIKKEEVQMSREAGQQQILGKYPNGPLSRQASSNRVWTEVTEDIRLVDHLVSLYFCWEYPTFASLSKKHFIEDFRAGSSRYCSPLLVNAMLALGCKFSDLPELRVDPSVPATGGDHFFAEAKRLLAEDDHSSLTTIQAIGLMSIREANCGRDTESFYYAGQAIRLAVEFGLRMETDEQNEGNAKHDEVAVRAATFWGAFSLDQAWGLLVGRIPHFSRAARLLAKPAIIDDVESSTWVPYTDEGVSDTVSANQPSNIRSVYKCFCELSELVHQSLYTLYAPERRLTSNEVVTIYMRYLNWYSSLPAALRLGHNFTPAVLFAHMYYHFAILLLFRPFVQLHFISSRVSPRDVCLQAADAIIALVRSYDQLYTLKRIPSFVPYIVLASCTIHLIEASSSSPAMNSLHQGINDLRDMSASDGFARRALYIIQILAQQWKACDAIGEDPQMSIEQVRKLCSHSPASLNFFSPFIIDHLPEGIKPGSSSTLFAPFPMQGLPFLLNDDELERNGFSKVP